MLLPHMVELLCCPVCPDEELVVHEREADERGLIDADLVCSRCSSVFPVRDGIPHLVDEQLLDADEWRLWKRHLAGIQARRSARLSAPDAMVNRVGKVHRLQDEFAAFTGIDGGVVLDVGCGPGKFRRRLGSDVVYLGVDPVPLPEAVEFPYVRAVAEHLPLKQGTVDHVTVLAALDHFRDQEAFFGQVARVLKPGGALHLMQSVHDVTGVRSALKWFAHEVKDRLEDRATKGEHSDTPKHMNEYGRRGLRRLLENRFDTVAERVHRAGFVAPDRIFMTLTPR